MHPPLSNTTRARETQSWWPIIYTYNTTYNKANCKLLYALGPVHFCTPLLQPLAEVQRFQENISKWKIMSVAHKTAVAPACKRNSKVLHTSILYIYSTVWQPTHIHLLVDTCMVTLSMCHLRHIRQSRHYVFIPLFKQSYVQCSMQSSTSRQHCYSTHKS